MAMNSLRLVGGRNFTMNRIDMSRRAEAGIRNISIVRPKYEYGFSTGSGEFGNFKMNRIVSTRRAGPEPRSGACPYYGQNLAMNSL